MSTLVRVEYLTADGWWTAHAGIALIDPGRYVARLAERGTVGRAIALDDALQPTGQRWEPACSMCGGSHQEGICLIL